MKRLGEPQIDKKFIERISQICDLYFTLSYVKLLKLPNNSYISILALIWKLKFLIYRNYRKFQLLLSVLLNIE